LRKKIYLSLTLMLILLFSVVSPVFSFSTMEHSIRYHGDGDLTLYKQAGHLCNTGAQMDQVIEGKGSLTKYTTIYMQKNYLQVVDNNDWITAADAVENLTVTTSIRLCSPAKHVYHDGTPVAEELLFPLLYLGVDAPIYPLTSQVWETSIAVAPGYVGRLHTGFDAAHGPYAGAFYIPWGGFFYLPAHENEWRFVRSAETGETSVEWGPAYVGDYFAIQQYASTSYGITRRPCLYI